MKKYLVILCCFIFLTACNSAKKKNAQPVTVTEKIKIDTIVFPYKPLYSSNFNNDVSDKDLLTVLNSYKFWESGFMVDLAGVYADTVTYIPVDGRIYSGTKKGLLEEWTQKRDSIKTIQIQIIAWTKVHEPVKGDNFIDVWYRETDTYKTGKVNVANYADRKQLVNGKINWYSQYKQKAN